MSQAIDAKGRSTPRGLVAATLRGDKVVNGEREELGTVDRFMVDLENGCVAYALLSSVEPAGRVNQLFAVPWSALKVDTVERQFVLNVDKSVFERAPGFDKDHWPNMADRDWGAEVASYYGAKPYWG